MGKLTYTTAHQNTTERESRAYLIKFTVMEIDVGICLQRVGSVMAQIFHTVVTNILKYCSHQSYQPFS